MSADSTGQGSYGRNVLAAGGLTLDRENSDGTLLSSGDLDAIDVIVSVTSSDQFLAEIAVSGIKDSALDPTVTETWLFRLEASSRAIIFNRKGSLIVTSPVKSVRAIRRQWNLEPTSATAFFATEGDVCNV
jgi:hypothetical protein